MRRPHRSTQGLRNDNALRPPETAQQQQRRVEFEIGVQRFCTNHQVCGRVPIFFTPSGQPRPVQEVAKELVGQYLISRESSLVFRIVETEAYQEHEQIYRNRFPEPPPEFRSPAGTLVFYPTTCSKKFMFITAGADDSGDLVLLRACYEVMGNPVIADRVNQGRPYDMLNMMSAPTKVGVALTPELGRDCDLLTASHGLYLVQKDPTVPLTMLEGPRVLPKNTANRIYSAMQGVDSRFRFAFLTPHPQTLQSRYELRIIENEP